MKKKNIWMIIGVLVILFFLYNYSRGVSTDFVRTLDKTNVKPGEAIRVTYTARNMGTNDYWLGELPLPSGMTFTPISVTATNINNVNGVIKFWGVGSTTVEFFLTPTNKGAYTLLGQVYHPKDDKVYAWCFDTAVCTYQPQIINAMCMARTDLLTYFTQWLQGQISTTQVITYIKEWVINPCPA